jgi:hypothetical protein
MTTQWPCDKSSRRSGKTATSVTDGSPSTALGTNRRLSFLAAPSVRLREHWVRAHINRDALPGERVALIVHPAPAAVVKQADPLRSHSTELLRVAVLLQRIALQWRLRLPLQPDLLELPDPACEISTGCRQDCARIHIPGD